MENASGNIFVNHVSQLPQKGIRYLAAMGHPRIVFMGTPEFAVASLDAMVKAGMDIAAVVTAPDRPAGRGMRLSESAVKRYAIEHGLLVLQPEKLRSPAFLQQLSDIKPDLQVVVAFRMLPEQVWNMPPMGTINLHASLLPKYRGAAPINHAIIRGDKETGLTTFLLKHEIDTGDILQQQSLAIGPEETAGELHDRMKLTGAALLVQTIAGLASGSLKPSPQADAGGQDLPKAPKIFTEDCRIPWGLPVQQVHDRIRGLSPVPGAFTHLQGRLLKIFRSKILSYTDAEMPGTIATNGVDQIHVCCQDGWLDILELQLEGKKRMTVPEFLRGNRDLVKGQMS